MLKIDKIDEFLRTTGEQLIDYSEESNSKFQAVRDQVFFAIIIK